MHRRATLLIATTALVAGLTACDTVDPYAAKVNGETIPMDEFQGDLEVLGDYLATSDPSVADESGIVADAARAYLGNLLVLSIAEDVAAERGAQFSGSPEELDALIAQIGLGMPASEMPAEMKERLGALAGSYLAGSSTASADDQAQLDAELAGVKCVSHILVASEEEAQAVLDRLADGEDFAALAAELSTDPGSGANGGALDTPDRCTSDAELDAFVPEFAEATRAAEFGVPTDPVKSDFGYHIILATEPSAEALDSRAKELTASLFNASLGPLLDEADITIAPSIGEWDPAQGVVALGTSIPASDLVPTDSVAG